MDRPQFEDDELDVRIQHYYQIMTALGVDVNYNPYGGDLNFNGPAGQEQSTSTIVNENVQQLTQDQTQVAVDEDNKVISETVNQKKEFKIKRGRGRPRKNANVEQQQPTNNQCSRGKLPSFALANKEKVIKENYPIDDKDKDKKVILEKRDQEMGEPSELAIDFIEHDTSCESLCQGLHQVEIQCPSFGSDVPDPSDDVVIKSEVEVYDYDNSSQSLDSVDPYQYFQERSTECGVCNQSFVNNDHLQAHMKIAHIVWPDIFSNGYKINTKTYTNNNTMEDSSYLSDSTLKIKIVETRSLKKRGRGRPRKYPVQEKIENNEDQENLKQKINKNKKNAKVGDSKGLKENRSHLTEKFYNATQQEVQQKIPKLPTKLTTVDVEKSTSKKGINKRNTRVNIEEPSPVKEISKRKRRQLLQMANVDQANFNVMEYIAKLQDETGINFKPA